MKIEIYHDGIAFYTEDKNYEIAFYSNVTDRVTYSNKNGYKDFKTIDCANLPYDDNKKIMDEIRRYKRSLEVGL